MLQQVNSGTELGLPMFPGGAITQPTLSCRTISNGDMIADRNQSTGSCAATTENSAANWRR